MNRLLNPELYVMLLGHNYENVAIHSLPEGVSILYSYILRTDLADVYKHACILSVNVHVHVCIYVLFYMFLIVFFIELILCFYDTSSAMTK